MFASVRTLLFGGLLGKALGVARELVSASLLGTGPIASAFRLSQAGFLIPLQGFLSDALGAGFTPTYCREREVSSNRKQALFATMLVVLLGSSAGIAALVEIFATQWVHLLAPGFDASKTGLATRMVRVMAAGMPAFAMTGLFAATELASGRADMAAARASVQSLGLIFGTLLAWLLQQPMLIPIGFVAAYVSLGLWGIRLARVDQLHLWPYPSDWMVAKPALHSVWGAFRMVVWIPVIMQIHFVIERRVASIVDVNAVAALDYARFVSETAITILAMPFGFAALGAMAQMSESQYRLAAWRSSRILLFIGVPASTALVVHTEWIVRVLYARGAFGADSVSTTVAILQWQSVGLWAQLVGYAGVKFLSARSNNASVVVIYSLAMTVNILLNITLARAGGVVTLGVSSAASGLILGCGILWKLGLVSVLRIDLISYFAATAGYFALWTALHSYIRHVWEAPTLFFVYWITVSVCVPRLRDVLMDIAQLALPNRMPRP